MNSVSLLTLFCGLFVFNDDIFFLFLFFFPLLCFVFCVGIGDVFIFVFGFFHIIGIILILIIIFPLAFLIVFILGTTITNSKYDVKVLCTLRSWRARIIIIFIIFLLLVISIILLFVRLTLNYPLLFTYLLFLGILFTWALHFFLFLLLLINLLLFTLFQLLNLFLQSGSSSNLLVEVLRWEYLT